MGRLGSAKSSTGCTTCKIRRVKCDETHPACRRCTSTGRRCDGFVSGLIVRIDPLSYQSNVRVPKDVGVLANFRPEQVRAHQFFVHRIVPNVTRVVSNEFWDRHLLQASLSQSSVWYAINAMSELVRLSQPGEVSHHSLSNKLTELRPALKWYSRSVSDLRKDIDYQSSWSIVYGITAILYFCIECLLDDLRNAQSIYQRAVFAMITTNREWKNVPSSTAAIDTSITAMFDHLATAHGLRPTSDRLVRKMMPNEAMTMESAREILTSELVHEAQEFAKSAEDIRLCRPYQSASPPEAHRRGVEILARLQWWASTVTALRKADPRCIDDVNWSVMHLVQLNYVTWVSGMMGASESAFDDYHPLFEEMLMHARTAIDAGGTIQPLFSFDTRVIPSLTFLATRCRHPGTRREAVRLLHVGPKMENTRKASSAIMMAQKIIAIEELGRSNAAYCEVPNRLSLPPDSNRLLWAKVEQETSDDGRIEILLKFARWQPDEMQNWRLISEAVRLLAI